MLFPISREEKIAGETGADANLVALTAKTLDGLDEQNFIGGHK